MKKITEKRNNRSNDIDNINILDALRIINDEDSQVINAIKDKIKSIGQLIDLAIFCLSKKGRIFYVGSGTSGRLGVLDAVECIPTFSIEPGKIIGIIAGGNKAMLSAVEGIEDNKEQSIIDLKKHKLSSKDLVIGISASGSTPYVLSALNYATSIGTKTGFLVCNNINSSINIDILIEIIVGPEIITGSTRLKAGTATKMVLNMISTMVMIKQNKTFGNYMVDLKTSNNKLIQRAVNMLSEILKISDSSSKELLIRAKGEVKTAIAMSTKNLSYKQAKKSLDNVFGSLKEILNNE